MQLFREYRGESRIDNAGRTGNHLPLVLMRWEERLERLFTRRPAQTREESENLIYRRQIGQRVDLPMQYDAGCPITGPAGSGKDVHRTTPILEETNRVTA